MEKKRTYTPLSERATGQGPLFKIKLLTLCLLRGLKKGVDFELSSDNKKDSGAFHDVNYEEDETEAILMQSKLKKNEKAKITMNELFGNSKSSVQLGQYLSSFCEITKFPKLLKVRLLTNAAIKSGNETDNLIKPVVIDSEDILYCTEAVKGYALTEQSRDKLRTQCSSVSEDHLSNFLEKFQLICIPDKELDKAIEGVLCDLELFNSKLHLKDATKNYIVEKVREWHKKRSGEYLRKTDAKAYLCTWRSKNYAQTLKNFNISFRRRNIYLYLVDEKFYTLGLIRVYQQFIEEHLEEEKIMIVNPHDSPTIQRDMVEAFANPECLLLIVPLYKDGLYEQLRIESLLQNISNKSYKTVAFFDDRDRISKNVPNVLVTSLRTCFNDLEETCKNAFLDATVDFQGKDVSLRDVLTPNGDANDIIDEKTLLMLSRGEKLKIKRVHDSEDIARIYIDRWFIRVKDKNNDRDKDRDKDMDKYKDKGKNEKMDRYSEREFCDLVMSESDQKFVLISDGAGMGKTTVLTKINEILQAPPYSHRWIIRLDLNRYANLYRELRKVEKKSLDVQDLLESTGKLLQSSFQKKLFNVPASVILIIDAVDEVSSTYTPIILKLLENCFERTNIAKIIMTTRPQLENVLETQLNVRSFKLELFSEPDQINFLTRYWATKLQLRLEQDKTRCELYATSLMQKLKNSIGHASWSFIGIPLQTIMVADVFQQGSGQHGFQRCEEFLRSERADVELNVDINVAKLYEEFIKKKGEIYVGKCLLGYAEEVLNRHCERAIKFYKKLALQLIMDTEKWQLFGAYRDANDLDEAGISDMGIVYEIGGTWIFSHLTFGEYFAAMCLWDELASGKASCAYLQFLMGHVLVSADFLVVRSFFENILANETVPEDVLQACGSAVGQIPWNESKNIVPLAKEGRLHTLKLLLERSSSHINLLQIEDNRGYTALHAATKSLPVVEYLFKKGACVNKISSIGHSVLHEAVLNNCADVVTFLIENGADVNARLPDGITPLHLADMCYFFNYLKCLDKLISKKPIEKEPIERWLVRQRKLRKDAATWALRIPTLLAEAGADVYARNNYGEMVKCFAHGLSIEADMSNSSEVTPMMHLRYELYWKYTENRDIFRFP